VTFVFSDIEGSTLRWEADHAAMERALRRHDALLSDAIARHGGYVFKTIGDAFCATFSDARAAVDAAIDIQRRLASEDWSEVDGLRVRIAIHAGVADERDGDYFGTAVNRVARLLATAHGGQIVVSNVVAQLVADSLPGGATLRDLGSHVLKDLRDPERVHQVDSPGLPTDFRPLRSLSARADNLPAQLTSFVGRTEELRILDRLVHESRLVTVLGAGGVGKTRLAIRAGEIFAASGGEVCFVTLAPLGDPHLVASAILAALGTSESNADPLDRVVRELRNRRVLLVLDTCEHVLEDVARIALAIAGGCSEAVVLCTSREPIGIAGERVMRLAPFDLETAVALFTERATTAHPTFVLDAANRPTVEAICERLDAIALAIELAAARLRVISLGELERRLVERFRILTGGSRSALPHHKTMRALIDWSYELLSEEHRDVFRRLAIFKRRFTLEAVAAVCMAGSSDEFAVLDLVSALVDKSLVVADTEGDGQFRMHALIEEYARERLHESGEYEMLAARHAAYYCEVAERAFDAWDLAPPPDWLERVAPDIDNVRSALRWSIEEHGDVALGARLAAAIGPAFLRLSLVDEGIAAYESARRANATIDDATGGRLAYVASMFYNNHMRFGETFDAAREALAAYERCRDERGIVQALAQLARQHARRGEATTARASAERAVALARDVRDPRLLASTLRRGAAVFEPADIDIARAWFAQSVELLRALGRDDETSRALEWWSAAEADAGHVDRALEIAREGLALAGPDARVYATSNVAAFAIVLGDDDLAYDMARESFGLAADVRHPVLLPLALTYLAALRANEHPAAAACLFGYAAARLDANAWKRDEIDVVVENRIRATLRAALSDAEVAALVAEGAAWDDARAILRGHSI
jgi:predicted ATPase/class 3 adenylate cyclase